MLTWSIPWQVYGCQAQSDRLLLHRLARRRYVVLTVHTIISPLSLSLYCEHTSLLSINQYQYHRDHDDEVWICLMLPTLPILTVRRYRTDGPYDRLFVRDAARRALYLRRTRSVGHVTSRRTVSIQHERQHDNTDANSFLLMMLRQRFDDHFNDEFMNLQCIV